MLRILRGSVAGLLSILFWFAGCSKELERPGLEILERTYAVDPAARLKISNLSGSISIHGADTEQLALRATKKATSVAALKNINVNVAAETGSISISTSALPGKKGSFMGANNIVDYDLVVPRTMKIARLELDNGTVLIEGIKGEDIRANVVDGELAVRNCCGDIQLAVANGALDLSFEDCGPEPFSAEAQIIHGNARVSLPRRASFHARAQTTSGKIVNDFADMVDVHSRTLQKIDVSVGRNVRSELAVRVTTGDISLVAIESDRANGQNTASNTGSQ